jgi:hypothetical protein
MKVRLKTKYYRGLVEDDPVLVSCYKYEERMALKGEFDKGSITKDEYNERRIKICSTVKRGEAKPIIDMKLQHGDFVVMHGADVQTCFEVRWNNPGEGHL